MNVSLTPRLEEIVRKKVESGLYNNASEVIREAIRQMEDRDRDAEAQFRAAIEIGLEDYRQGRTIPWTPELINELRQEARERTRLGLPIKPDVLP